MKRLSAIVACCVLIGACSDSDGPTDPVPLDGTELTVAEAAALAGLFALEAMGASEGQEPGAAAVAGESVPFSFDVAVTVPCPLGGEVAFSGAMNGAFDTEAESLSLSFVASQVHSECAVDAEGVRFTVSGNPGIELRSSLEAAGDPPQGSHTATLSGGFDWTTDDGREGTCVLDISASMDLGTETGTSSGSVCGHSVNASIG